MKSYRVFSRTDKQFHKVVKIGFNWPAFFFTWLWTLTKVIDPSFRSRSSNWWTPLRICAVIAPLIYFGAHFLRESIVFIAFQLIFAFICGLKGNQWWCLELTQSGWNHVADIEAASSYRAIQEAKSIEKTAVQET